MLDVTFHIVCNYYDYHDYQPEGSQGGSTPDKTRKHKYELSESLKGGYFLTVEGLLAFEALLCCV
jgi:hypothetical protein